MREIVRMVYGSHLFGTNIENSDRDFKSIFLPSARTILLQKVRHVALAARAEQKKQPDQADVEYLSLQRYLELLCEGQTVAVDMAFIPKEYYGARRCESGCEPEWMAVRNNLPRLVSAKMDIFTGFAKSQVRRYSTKADRLSAAEAAHGFFVAMEDIHGPNTKVVQVRMDLMSLVCDHPQDVMHFLEIPNPKRRGVSTEHFECCDRKVPLGASVKEAAHIYGKVCDFYGKRSKLAQQMGGQDWKALYHAVRIVSEAEELLTEGKITFPRPEAQLLLRIRQGEVRCIRNFLD